MSATVFTSVEKHRPVIRQTSAYVLAFLHGSIVPDSALSKLRGLDHILKAIWVYVCEEWWDLHIERFPVDVSTGLVIPKLIQPWIAATVNPDADEYMQYPKERQRCAGCPVAVLAENIVFPEVAHVPENTFQGQESPHLYVNMMPFVLQHKATLPEFCVQYWPLIEKCLEFTEVAAKWQVGYLTIDERPVVSGHSQRRGGLHVESPGVMPLIQHDGSRNVDYNIAVHGDVYIPGAEHHWGGGMMMRDEHVEGGIFMASNVANTTAVWSCHIHDEDGDFIGPHGDIERFRELLGPCARTLDAGELIWMTDRTPHESLPVPLQPDGTPVRRQYFRLVIGTVTAWFADHSTPNPLGQTIPKDVRVVRGNKFELYSPPRTSWHCGTAEQVYAATELRDFRLRLLEYGLRHIADKLLQFGIKSIGDLVRYWQDCEKNKVEYWDRWASHYGQPGLPLTDMHSTGYYEQPQLEALIKQLLTDRKKAAALAGAAEAKNLGAAVGTPGKGSVKGPAKTPPLKTPVKTRLKPPLKEPSKTSPLKDANKLPLPPWR